MRRFFSLLLGSLLLVALTMLSLSHGWEGPRRAAYAVARAYERQRAIRHVPTESLASGAITLHFDPIDRDVAPFVLAELERLHEPVAHVLGTPVPASVVAVLHPTRADLAAVFGWNDSERAHGVYAGGIVRLLSPRAWVHTEDTAEMAAAFQTAGPVAHELAHLALDYYTGGNYTAWLSEGIAQWAEVQLGSVRLLSDKTDWQGIDAPYTLLQLEREFDQLPDQDKAYRQSYLAVAYLAEQGGGPEAIQRFIANLARGHSVDAALQAEFGLTRHTLQERLLAGEKPSPGGTERERN